MGSNVCRGLRVLLSVALGLVLSPGTASAQGWIQQRYTTRNGLPQNSVLALAMDSIGYLWVTTEGGLVRCDGDRFKRLPISATGNMGPERMRQLIPTLEKDLYVNDSRGNIYLVHGHVTVVPVPIGTAHGLTILGGFPGIELFAKALDKEHPLPGRSRWPAVVQNCLPVNKHDWYVQCDQELLIYRDSTLLDSLDLPPHCSRLFLNGGHLFGFDDAGAFRMDPARRTLERVPITDQYGAPTPLTSGARTLSWSPDDPFAYLFSVAGLYTIKASLDGKELVTRRMDLELPQACVITSVIVSDKYHMVAVGTDTKGLFIYHPRYMRTVVASTEGSTGNSFYAQAPLPGNGVLVATNNDSAFLFDGSGRRIDPAPVRSFSYQGILRARDGGIWFSRMPGLERLDPSSGRIVSMVEPPPTTTFTRFLEEGDSIWLADEAGIHCWRNGDLRQVFAYTGPEAFRHAQFIRREDPQRLWVGTCEGLYRLSTATGRTDTVDAFRGRCVRAMERIGEYVFVGTYGSGAFVQDGDGFRSLPKDPLGYLSHVHSFLADSTGGLWMSTNRGLFRMRLGDVAAVLADTSYMPYMDYFGEWAGIENSEFNGGCDPSSVRLSDGTASFPTLGGLVWFRPESIPDMRPSAPVMIEEVVVDGKVWPVDEFMVFEPDTRAIEVLFSLPYWGDPETVHLEYWLKGRLGGWAQLDHGKRSLRFRDLPPGEYELLLRKAGSRDLTGAGQVWFSVRKRFYQRTWAQILLVVLGVLLIWMMLRWNEARLRRMNRWLEQRVRERTSELEEANRGLRASMELKQRLVSIISHDIVTPLRFIERVARGGARTDVPRDAAELSETLRDISFSAEKLYANARNTLSWIRNQEGGMELRPRHVALNPLVEELFDVGRSLAQSKELRLVNDVSLDDVVRTDRDVLSIILHNLITNAVTHTESGEVRVSGEPVMDGYTITVSDTGHGMSETALAYIHALRSGSPVKQETPNEEGVHGLGYVIIIELVRLLGASMDVYSSQGEGTRVKLGLRIPE